MKKCMQTDKPLVSILLAVYKPNIKWLIEQLVSLNEQSYENLNLFVYDDCPDCPVNEEIFEKYITNFDYTIIRGKVNQGSNKAFEELTKIANGVYFAYCDQDDIWEKQKILELVKIIQKQNSVIAYSDMNVIDSYGNLMAKSLKELRPRLKYIYGNNLYNDFIFKNCVAGCSMIMLSKVAKKCIPFSSVTVHDQWLCILGSYFGKVSFLNDQLIKYRIHNNNQTGVLFGVTNKNKYYKLRVDILSQRINELEKVISKKNLYPAKRFADARVNKKIIEIFKYRYFNRKDAYFEILIKYMPDWMFKIIIKKIREKRRKK